MSEDLARIAAPLVAWYQENKRPLPWRQDREPYHVWISEIMLQQTRIEAVMGYYGRFMKAVPDIETLSALPEEQLLKLWEGLGYYSRARNLKKAAQVVMEEYGGRFPARYDDLLRLPGIGEYTAAAIASLCFNEAVPAVDGNVLRVIARITGSRENVLLDTTKKAVAKKLRAVIPAEAGAFNEGLMELGEVRCLPNGLPLCGDCPLQSYCRAAKEHTTDEIPVRIKKIKRKKEKKTVLLLLSPQGKLAIEKRQEKGLLSGMYQLPNISGALKEAAITDYLKAQGITPLSVQFFKKEKHIFTHIEWEMPCYTVKVAQEDGDYLWVSEQALDDAYPLPTAFKKIVRTFPI